MCFEKKEIQVRFQVVNNNFPVSHDGILGKEFLEENKIAIDYAKKEISNNEENYLSDQNIKKSPTSNIFIVPPRSEMIIPIQIMDTQIKENETLIIHTQAIQNLVQCGNIVTTVKDRQALTKIVNQNENSITLHEINFNDLSYEKFEEADIHVCNKVSEEIQDDQI